MWTLHPLTAALLISVVIHACILWSLPGLSKNSLQRADLPRTLQVKLSSAHEPSQALPEPQRDLAKRPTSNSPAPGPVAKRPEFRTVPQTRSQPAPEFPRAPAEEPNPAPPLNSSPSPAGAPTAPPGPPLTHDTAPGIPRHDAAEVDRDALDGYGQALSRTFARFQRYPRLAQMRRWQGKVQVRLQIAPGGKLVNATVTQSSGYEVLDQQALEIIKEASPLPPVPEALQAKTFTVVVPILFRLENS